MDKPFDEEVIDDGFDDEVDDDIIDCPVWFFFFKGIVLM